MPNSVLSMIRTKLFVGCFRPAAELGPVENSAMSKNVDCRVDSLRSKSLASNRDSWSASSPEGAIKSFSHSIRAELHPAGEENLQRSSSDPEATVSEAGAEEEQYMVISERSFKQLRHVALSWQVQAQMWKEQSEADKKVIQQQEEQIKEKDELIYAAKNKFKEIQYYRIQTLRAQDNSRNARAEVARMQLEVKQLEKQLKKAQQGTRLAISHIRSLEREKEERAMQESDSPRSPKSPKSPKSPRSPRFTI